MTSIIDSIVESDVSEASDVSVEKPKLNLRDIVNAPPSDVKEAEPSVPAKKPRKKRIPQELKNLQDTEEYMEASRSVKGDVNSERGRRPPRRAAVIARENVNLLRGKEPTAAELRENRSFEKSPDRSSPEPQDSLRDQIISINSSGEESEAEAKEKPTERKKSPSPPPVQPKPRPPPLKKAPSRESAIPKPPQLKRRPEPLPSPVKSKIPNLSPTISKLPDFKPKLKSPKIEGDSKKPEQPQPKKMKEEKKEQQENESSETKSKKVKKEKELDPQDLSEIKKKNEEYEIAFQKVSKLFYDWIEQRAKTASENGISTEASAT
ncbi:Oidioi.mRNA.OKI2018_I69.chr2.g8343.t1.cds [Oikopleura dioica]|uniref:Oidioi.mRNA.OKI2018_I69.chr2.g8343.t1.cds n=1 Tax=Oikopleura dioica TaxID=34765 RepID=A0ABN7TGR4_OIKDI|nr:Oidioi.mRNA.OKI2018_I69.chr2.g8343.t1.cds [Oikopleura dioica]